MDWSVVGGNPVPVDIGSVLGCARSLRSSACELRRWQRDAQALFGRTATVWKGRAGRTYARSGTETVGQSTVWDDRLQQAAEALVRFADEVEALNARAAELVIRAVSYAEELHSIEIDQWYKIKLGISGWTGEDPDEQSLQIRLDAVRRHVEQVRADFVAAERRVVRAIAEQPDTGTLIRSGGSLGASQHALAALAVDEKAGWFPVTNRLLATMGSAQVAALFADLTPAATRALALFDPAGVGNLDGVPLSTRAMANHFLIERDRQLVVAAGDGKRLKVLDVLIASGGSLVVYEPALDHYGVLFGDQDARHVAVLIPGVGSDASLGGWIGDAYSVWARSPESAVIMWKGYDDPGDHGMIPDAADAGFTAWAEDGARGLAAFADGLALANHQSLTVIAYGYGTVMTALALAREGLAPTSVVALGGPGMAVDGGTRLATNCVGMPDVKGHSQYFAHDSPALDGISHVVTGSRTSADLRVPSPGSADNSNGASRSVQSAANRLAEAEQLVADLVRAVAPTAVAAELLPARKLQPQPCSAADAGLVYYTFDRQFEAGGDVTGAFLVPAIESQLKSRGFDTHDPGPTGGWITRTARNGQIGLDILGAPAAGTVRIGVDTQCGTP